MPKLVQLPKRPPDLRSNDWIRAVREELKLSEANFAAAISAAGGRDTVAKWVSKDPQEPSFTHTRRIVTIAPADLVRLFVGEKRLDLGPHGEASPRSKPDGAVDTIREMHHVLSVQASALAEALDEITDKKTRSEVLRKCLNLIAEAAHHPSELGAEMRPGRAQRK